jgi:hypothetical protein
MVFKKFWKLPRKEKAKLLEAFFCLLTARLVIFLFPFRKIAPGVGEHMKETPKQGQPQYTQTLHLIRQAINRVSRHLPWKSTCLVKSIAGKMMLKRRKIPFTLYLGLIREEEMGKNLKAHAWLRSGNIILTGKERVSLSAFTVVSMFGGDDGPLVQGNNKK